MNTHIQSLKVWLKSILPWLKYSIFSRGLFFIGTPCICISVGQYLFSQLLILTVLTISPFVWSCSYTQTLISVTACCYIAANILTGCLVISVYAPCPDIRATVTPDLKCPNDSGMFVNSLF